MTIAVTTPTGQVGSRVVRLLLQAGVRPRFLARDPARLDAAVSGQLDVRRGDLTDAAFVREAVAGARTVFWVDPTPHWAEDPIQTSEQTAASLADAARAGDVARVVLLSSIGAEKRHGVGHIDGLARIEEQLDSTGADVLHLRCGLFFTNLLLDLDGLERGVLTTAALPDRPMPWVDPRDIGDVVAVRLLSDTWQGRVVQAVHGDAGRPRRGGVGRVLPGRARFSEHGRDPGQDRCGRVGGLTWALRRENPTVACRRP